MRVEEYVDDNLTMENIDEIVTRVKVFIFNGKGQILILTSDGGCQLAGGHLDGNETVKQGIIREVKEETGITLNNEEIDEPFYEIRYLTKNYKNSNKNRMSNVFYSVVITDKKPDLTKINLTENEKINNLSVKYIDKENFEKFVSNFINDTQKEINKIIASEILKVFKELKNIIKD